MNIPLIIIYFFAAVGLLISSHEHGKPRGEGKNNFWITSISYIIQLVLIWWALGWRFI